MAVTFKPKHAKDAEVFLAVESSENVFTETGAVQVSHRGIDAGLNHSPIEGRSATGTSQVIIGDAFIRGVHRPAVRFVCPLRWNTFETIMDAAMGVAHTNGVWAAPANVPTSWSVGVNDGEKYEKFAGCFCAEVAISLQKETVGIATVTFAAQSMAVVAASGNFPAITPDQDSGANARQVPFTLKDFTFKHHTAVGSVAGATAIPMGGVDLTISRDVEEEHYNACDPTLTPGYFLLSGTMAHRISTEYYTEFDHLAQPDGTGYSTEYVELKGTSTPTSKVVTFLFPSRWTATRTIPATGLMDVALTFGAGGDDSSFTTDTLELSMTDPTP